MREWIGSLGVWCARSRGGLERGLAVEQAVFGSSGWAREIVAAEGNEQAAEFGAVFQIHAEHFGTGLMRAHEAHDGAHAARQPDAAVAAMAHEIAFRNGIEGRELKDLCVQT